MMGRSGPEKGSSTLQEVTNAGATTTKEIIINPASNTNPLLVNNSSTGNVNITLRIGTTGKGLIKVHDDAGTAQVQLNADIAAASYVVGPFGVGTNGPNSKAILTVSSTTLGFLPPRMTTTQRDAITSPTEGLVVYNSTTHTLDFYNGTAWKQIAGA